MARMVVTCNALNLRKSPSLTAEIANVLLRDEEVEFIGASSDNYWFKVRCSGDREGWASHKFLTAAPAASATSSPWFEVAEAELGVHEMPGFRNNARIIQYLKSTTLGEPYCSCDETPWCSSFVNWCMERSGYEGTGSAAARSWLDWGKEVDRPCPGCIAVFTRGGGGHVGFYVGETAETVKVLGGNQGDQVSVREYPKSRLLGYRMPRL